MLEARVRTSPKSSTTLRSKTDNVEWKVSYNTTNNASWRGHSSLVPVVQEGFSWPYRHVLKV